MTEFSADLRDLELALFEGPFNRLLALPAYRSLDRQTLSSVLAEAYRFARGELAPLDAEADQTGTRFDPASGAVQVPPSFLPAYERLTAGGWVGLAQSTAYGGQGMPSSVELATYGLFYSACLSFCLELILGTGVGRLIERYGTQELKRLYVAKLYSGSWAGTMCLTEAGAGSDVGASRARAVRHGDHFLLGGEKSFITYGEHQLTENIVHAVLARIEGAPAGSRGLSLFVVPKLLVHPDGTLGEPNDVRCTGIEHKLGIRASPTCTLLFGGAGRCVAFLVGEENKGLAAMFQLMNEARLHVGLQGNALASIAYERALAFARERLQGRDWRRPQAPGQTPIITHPDVRRMLMWQKALSEGTRALLLRTAVLHDLSEASEDPAERATYARLTELLTPVCKAFCADAGFRSVELSLQTLGGYGYLRDYHIERHLRDAKIASIYEGTNGIQALDLAGRKLHAHGGVALQSFVELITTLINGQRGHPCCAAELELLAQARDALVQAAATLGEQSHSDRGLSLLGASPFLELFGEVAVGFLLLEQGVGAFVRLAAIGQARGVPSADSSALSRLCAEHEEARFFFGKLKVAQFYARQVLAHTPSKAARIVAGDRSPLEIEL